MMNVKKIKVAYLNTRYPALSHTFIEREIRAVRSKGVEVHTFSVRRPAQKDLLSRRYRGVEEETTYILDGMASFIRSIFHGALFNPIRFILCLLFAQNISPPGLKMRGLHLVYALESIRLAMELKRRDLTHIHVHMANNGATVALLACVYDRRLHYSMTVHGSAEFFNVDRYYLKIKAERALFVRCISHFCKAQIMIWTDSHKWNDFHIIHCGVDINRFALKEKRDTDNFSILFVGRLEPIKGLTVLLKTFKKLIDSNIDCELNIVGEGPMKIPLMETSDVMGISERVVFSGAVGQDEILDHYDRAHVMVISSFMEGVPVVLMEAMAKGLAVVSTHVGGVSELIEDGVNGLLVAPASSDSLFHALFHLADNREKSVAMGNRGRKKIMEEFSINEIGGRMAELFDKYMSAEEGIRS